VVLRFEKKLFECLNGLYACVHQAPQVVEQEVVIDHQSRRNSNSQSRLRELQQEVKFFNNLDHNRFDTCTIMIEYFPK
jgi:hypothetical protein